MSAQAETPGAGAAVDGTAGRPCVAVAGTSAASAGMREEAKKETAPTTSHFSTSALGGCLKR